MSKLRNTARIIFLALLSFAFLSCNRNASNQGVSPPAFDVPLTSIPSGDTYIAEKRKEANVYIPTEIQQTDGFEWFFNDKRNYEIIITRYVGTNSEVTIPDAINGMPVTVIEENAFADKQLTSVIIPNSVFFISDGAFANNRLTGINIPNSVVYIRDGAFSRNRLTSVTIPDSVEFIGSYAFARNQLTSIVIPPSIIAIGNSVFEGTPLTSITIGENMPVDLVYVEGILGIDVSFDQAYGNSGRRAGTYTRPNANSRTWTRR